VELVEKRSGEAAQSWRPLLAASGIVLLVAGGTHPDGPKDVSFRDTLAAMMEDGKWVPAHTLLTVSMVLLVAGLMAARRSGLWAPASRLLPFAILAAAVNTVEAVLHTVSVVDKEELAAGESPPLAVAHLAAAVIAYPMIGIAIAALAWMLMPSWSPALRVVSIIGVIGGVAYSLSAPLVVVARQQDLDFLFALGAGPMALWLAVIGIAGLRRPSRIEPVPATAP
jgi:hypothetical protein